MVVYTLIFCILLVLVGVGILVAATVIDVSEVAYVRQRFFIVCYTVHAGIDASLHTRVNASAGHGGHIKVQVKGLVGGEVGFPCHHDVHLGGRVTEDAARLLQGHTTKSATVDIDDFVSNPQPPVPEAGVYTLNFIAYSSITIIK